MSFILHNGSFTNDHKFISVRDMALRGGGVFDTSLAVEGSVVDFNLHAARLLEHAKIMGVTKMPSRDKLHEWVKSLLEKNDQTSGHVRVNIMALMGENKSGLQRSDDTQTHIVIQTSPIIDKPPPLSAVISLKTRRNERSVLSQIKSLNYGDNIIAVNEAKTKNATDAIMLNTKGRVACFTVGNIFLLKNGKLSTPALSEGAMNGIIRKKWIEKTEAEERKIKADELEEADAIFRTNAVCGIMQLKTLDGKKLRKTDFKFDQSIHLR